MVWLWVISMLVFSGLIVILCVTKVSGAEDEFKKKTNTRIEDNVKESQ